MNLYPPPTPSPIIDPAAERREQVKARIRAALQAATTAATPVIPPVGSLQGNGNPTALANPPGDGLEGPDSAQINQDLKWLIGKESGGRTDADNPTSTAFGLGQLIEANRIAYAKKLGVSPDTQDYNAQLQMMKMYIKDRYGSPTQARRFWESHNWY